MLLIHFGIYKNKNRKKENIKPIHFQHSKASLYLDTPYANP